MRGYPPLADDERILIVLLGALGDVCRALSIVAPLKRARPNGSIAWVVNSAFVPLLAAHPDLSTPIPFSLGKDSSASLRQIREFAPTCVLDLQRIFKSGIISRLSGAPRRIGFHRRNSKEGNWLFQSETVPPQVETYSKLDHYHTFLEQVSVPSTKPYTFGLDALRVHLNHPNYPSRGVPRVALVLGSRWESKDWVQAGYEELLSTILREEPWEVLLLGDGRQAALGALLASRASGDRVVNLTGTTSLSELAAWLASSAAVIGPDSGPGHLASALGVPYVTLFGPTTPDRVVPYGAEHLALHPIVGCAPCERRVCPGLNRICMRLHRVSDVFRLLQAAVSSD